MGFMWINKNVKVNCEKNYKDDKRLTLVDNKWGEAHDFSLSTDLLKYLLELIYMENSVKVCCCLGISAEV